MANDPVLVTLPKSTWVNVTASIGAGVTSGTIYLRDRSAQYVQTIRVVSDANPDPNEGDLDEAVRVYSEIAEISATEAIHVWMRCDDQAGLVRVDI